MTDAPTPEQLDALTSAIESQNAELSSFRAQTKQQSEALTSAEKVLRRAIYGIGLAILIALGGLWIGFYGQHTADQAGQAAAKANHALELQELARQERTIASCLQTNDFYEKHNALVQNDQETFRIIVSQTQSDSAREFAQARLNAFETNKVPLRDCTLKGIEKYLSTTTTVPAEDK